MINHFRDQSQRFALDGDSAMPEPLKLQLISLHNVETKSCCTSYQVLYVPTR